MFMPMLGAIAPARVSFSSVSGDVTDIEFDPGIATATISFDNDGTMAGVGNAFSFSGEWIDSVGAASDAFEIRLTVNSGTTPSGSGTGSWLGLGTSRSWLLTQSGTGTTIANVTIEIRKASSGTVLDSDTLDITAEVSV